MKKVLCFLVCITFLEAAPAQEYLPKPCTGPKQELIPFLKGGKWGFCNHDKKLVIPAVYDDASAFGTVPLNAAKLHYPTPEQAYVRKGKEEFWINAKGENTPLTGGMDRDVNDGEMVEMIREKSFDANFSVNGKYGFILKGDTVIPALYDEVRHLPNGDFYLVLNDKVGVMDSSMNWIVPMQFEKVAQIRLNNERYPVMSRGYRVMQKERWGLYVKGRQVIPVKYRQIINMEVWSFDWYKAQNENGSWCLLDANGKVMGSMHDEFGNYDGEFDRMAVKDKGRWGFIDSKGNKQIACKYSEVSYFHNVSGLAIVKDGKSRFFIDCAGVEYRSR